MTVQSRLIKEAFRYQSALTAYAYGALRDWALAEDAVQDAFVVLLDKYPTTDPEKSAVYPLMKEIVRLKTLEILRKRSREIAVEEDELNQIVSDTLTDELSAEVVEQHNLRVGVLRQCMSKVSTSGKDLLIGYYWERKSCEELAKTTGRSAPSLRVMLMRLRRKLLECVKGGMRRLEVVS